MKKLISILLCIMVFSFNGGVPGWGQALQLVAPTTLRKTIYYHNHIKKGDPVKKGKLHAAAMDSTSHIDHGKTQ